MGQRSAAGFIVAASLVWAGGGTAAAADPLFESDAVLDVRISGPLSSLARDRAATPDYRPATLTFVDSDGAERSLDVGLRPRGNSRRDREVCTVPPLRLNLRRKAVAGTLFEGQDKLKLVTHCRSTERHQRYLYREYLAYRILNQLTEVSFRVRPLNVEWVDEDRGERERQRFAFLIEHQDRLAARLDMQVADVGRISPQRHEPGQAGLAELFQFMIGNTDFSFTAAAADETCCHNAVLLAGADDLLRPVPYDFDMSGLVDAPYATVNSRLPISNVRTRLYRGFCREAPAQQAAVARFRATREQVLAVLGTETAIDDDARASVLRYAEQFYAVLDDPGQLARQVLEACRG